ncbi:MAG: hypothetical protein GY823_09300 [Flavobacteriaceae bacterium]|nr:hypothetical protein [Flavobacteriaceae bacterium]
MNFMQGDEYDVFKYECAENDRRLMEFYDTMLYTFPIVYGDTMTFINKVMWTYISVDQIRAKY